MATSRLAPNLHPTLLSRLEEARARTDALFQMLPPNSYYDRPVPERHRLIFYLGHLEAFDWNLFAPGLGLKSNDPEYDKLFAFGIDPVGDGLPTDMPADWPSISRVERYNQRARTALDDALQAAEESRSSVREIADGTLLQVAIEHRLMHAETLAYLLHNLPVERKIAQAGTFADPHPAPNPEQVVIPAGIATLGQSRNFSQAFGWDNEFGLHQVHVPGFLIDAFPITNHEYLKFVNAGGYQDASYWTPEDWEWKQRTRLAHPHFWLPKSKFAPADSDAQWELPGDVRDDPAAAIVARLRHSRRSIRVRTVVRKETADRDTVAPRSLWIRRWRRKCVPMGRGCAGSHARKFSSRALGSDRG